MSTKPHGMRVRVCDGKPRKWNELKGWLMPFVDVRDVMGGIEFTVSVSVRSQLDQVRAKLAAAGLEEMPGGITDTPPVHTRPATTTNASRPERKPYGFVPLPDTLTTASPIWHDATGAEGRLSGEIRCEISTLTPLLVGWERQRIGDNESWRVPSTRAGDVGLGQFLQAAARQVHPDAGPDRKLKVDNERSEYIKNVRDHVVDVQIAGVGRTIETKSVLCPLRAPWGERPVLLPGDSLKGLLRHELGALLGAPMERVAERSYSYRPNSLYPKDANPRLVARLARVVEGGVELWPLEQDGSLRIRVPTKLALLPENLKYDKDKKISERRYRFDVPGAAAYRGGQGAGKRLNSKHRLHESLEAQPDTPTTVSHVPETVLTGYCNTVKHLVDLNYGHFSERHPDVPRVVTGEEAEEWILHAATTEVFTPGDLIWVEWDTRNKRIVSFGWHYYYRWAYVDTVRRTGWTGERPGLFPLEEERHEDGDGAPRALSAVRRLFGYTGDNDGSRGIGRDDHEQLMGRLSVNAAIEMVGSGDTVETRFLPPTFLKELGMPRPSAVEHYLEQPYHPNQRPSDRASLATYGDAAGYDVSGRLAGRKFYLDRKDAYSGEPWLDSEEANRLNERSTLALEASRRNRRFRFTVRFQNLDPAELAAVLVALAPHQFHDVLGGDHADGYCSKLGYARPLGWGTVRIEAKGLLLFPEGKPVLEPVDDLSAWVKANHQLVPERIKPWLAVHRHKHPDAGDYPVGSDGKIYSYHTNLRAQHSRARRYERRGRP